MRKVYMHQVEFIDGSSEAVTGHEVDAGSEGTLNILLWEDEKARYEDSVVFAVPPGQWKFVRRGNSAWVSKESVILGHYGNPCWFCGLKYSCEEEEGPCLSRLPTDFVAGGLGKLKKIAEGQAVEITPEEAMAVFQDWGSMTFLVRERCEAEDRAE